MLSLSFLDRVGRLPATLAGAALVALVLGGPGGPAAAAEETVRIASSVQSVMSLPLYVADAGGFFAREGVKVEVSNFQGGGPPANAALLGGSIDLLSAAFENQLKLVKQGQPVVAVVGIQSSYAGAVVIRKDIAQKLGHKPTSADLKGLRIGTLARGGFADSGARYVVSDAGLDPDKDVSLVPLRGFDKHIVAGKAGEIDASFMIEPWPFVAIDETGEWVYVQNISAGEGPAVFKDIGYITLSGKRDWIARNRATVEKVVRAIVAAERFINDPANLDKVVEIAKAQFPESQTETLRKSIKVQLDTYKPQLGPENVAKNTDLLIKAGNAQLPLPRFEDVVDVSFAPLWK